MSVAYVTAVFEARVKPASAKLVLLALADHADERGECYPSIDRLMRYTSLSRAAVYEAVGVLKAVELVQQCAVVKKGDSLDGYRVLLTTIGQKLNGNGLSPESGQQPPRPESRQDRPQSGQNRPDSGSHIKKNRQEPSGTVSRVLQWELLPGMTTALKADFRNFYYEEYPRREAPTDAARAYLKARRSASHEDIIAGVRASTAKWAKERRPADKVPYPASYLNDGQHEAVLDQAEPAPAKPTRANFDTDENLHNSPAWRAKRDAEEGRGRGNR